MGTKRKADSLKDAGTGAAAAASSSSAHRAADTQAAVSVQTQMPRPQRSQAPPRSANTRSPVLTVLSPRLFPSPLCNCRSCTRLFRPPHFPALSACCTDALWTSVTPCLSLDCEFVGVGSDGKDDALARVSLVNFHEVVLYDRFVKPSEPVTDYRTAVSGIKPSLVHGKSAISFSQAQREVAKLIEGRILVGHAIHNDLGVLQLSHPKHLLRDTSRSRLLCPEGRPRSLKNLAREVLSLKIQAGAHDSVQDARVTLQLYKHFRVRWEKEIFEKTRGGGGKHAPAAAAAAGAAGASSSSSVAPAAAASSAASSSAASSARPASGGGGSFSAKRAAAQAESDAAKLEARRLAKVERNQRRKKMRTEQRAEKQFG